MEWAGICHSTGCVDKSKTFCKISKLKEILSPFYFHNKHYSVSLYQTITTYLHSISYPDIIER